MKKTVPFELFEENQYLMLDILRLAELERAMGCTVIDIAQRRDAGVNFCLTALPIAMKQHYRPDPTFYAAKIEAYLESGGILDDIAVPLVKAIAASGVFGQGMKESIEQAEQEATEGKNAEEGAK
jgi:hypothetical protein